MMIGNIYIDAGWHKDRLRPENWYKITFIKGSSTYDNIAPGSQCRLSPGSCLPVGSIEVYDLCQRIDIPCLWTIHFQDADFLEKEYGKWYSLMYKTFTSSEEAKDHVDKFLQKLSELKIFI